MGNACRSTCVAGKCSSCTHVAALLFYINNYNRTVTTLSCIYVSSMPVEYTIKATAHFPVCYQAGDHETTSWTHQQETGLV